MATLISPGVSVTVIDQSQYASSSFGTVPLIFIATAANKIGTDGVTVTSGTQTSNTLTLLSSQLDLVTQFGNPLFEINNGTIVQGSEVSEYGLKAAYDYLGVANSAYVIRADIDLSQLTYSETPPTGAPVNGTYWLDTTNTSWGVFRSNGNPVAGLAWTSVPTLIPTATQVDINYVPLSSFGSNGNIAVVTLTTNNAIYEKVNGNWYLIGSAGWQLAHGPTISTGAVANPVFTIGNTIIINGVTVTLTGTTLSQTVSDINSAEITNITASISVGNQLVLQNSNGGNIVISGTAATTAGIVTKNGYNFVYANHINIPTGSNPGDIWIKTTNPNYGANIVVKLFTSTLNQFSIITAPFYLNDAAATTGYGSALAIGSLYVNYNANADGTAIQVIKRYTGTGWTILNYVPSLTAPTTSPTDGTLWINDAFMVDIMVNTGNAWDGYLNKYPATDPNGVQITSAQPFTQSGGLPLVDNDLWLDSSDVVNYPALYRWYTSSNSWNLINKADTTTPFGVVFGDARATNNGLNTGSTLITDILVSNFVDPDAPNPEVYPADILLFNTRYSTYNVKKYESTKFANQQAYTVGAYSNSGAIDAARWITASGNDLNGVAFFGRFAQHQMVVLALNSIIVSNDEIRSEFNFFNLIAAPNYPETISNLQNLNIDRKETAFIIADTPMHLISSATAINNWATNTANVGETNEFGRTTLYTYSAEYYPQGLGTDSNGNSVAMPASAIALSTYAYNDSVAYPWYSPAGTQRGIVQNASSVGYVDPITNKFVPVVLNQGQRDTLYTNSINPIAFLPNRGLIVYGDKTLSGDSTALNRINVARLICYLRAELDAISQDFLFQLNNESTRNSFQTILSNYLGGLLSLNALTDFAVVCDTTNNTPERIDSNELWADIAIIPQKSINFVYLPIRILPTGTNLN